MIGLIKVYNSSLKIDSSISVRNSFFASFSDAIIVCRSYVDASIESCTFMENCRFGDGACIYFYGILSSRIRKCIVQNCFTYINKSYTYSNGQFCLVNVEDTSSNENNMVLTSMAGCAPFYDGKERRSVCHLLNGALEISDLNISYSNVIQQILYCSAPGTAKRIISSDNQIIELDIMFRSGKISASECYVLNTKYLNGSPSSLFFEENGDITLDKCAVVSEVNYVLRARPGSKVVIRNSYLTPYSIYEDSDITVSDECTSWTVDFRVKIRDIALSFEPFSNKKRMYMKGVFLSSLVSFCKYELILTMNCHFKSSSFSLFKSVFIK